MHQRTQRGPRRPTNWRASLQQERFPVVHLTRPHRVLACSYDNSTLAIEWRNDRALCWRSFTRCCHHPFAAVAAADAAAANGHPAAWRAIQS